MANEELIRDLRQRGLFIATAESLTGGMLGQRLTEEPGASEFYLGGVVAYQNGVKEQLLGVSPSLIANQGAVDAEVAAQMASGVRQRFARATGTDSAQVIGVATTGVAGPAESDGKPAGTVFIGISSHYGESVYAFTLQGNRESVRSQTVTAAFEALREQLQADNG